MTALDVVIAVVALLGFAGAWSFGGRGLDDAAVAALAFGAAGVVAALVPRNPVAAVGLVILLSPLGKLVVELPLGTMRLEHPAIAALLVASAIHWRRLRAPSLRPLLPLLLAAGAYLLVITLSSLLVAPQPMASLRIVIWSLLSMLGGLAAAWLTATRPAAVTGWFTAAGTMMAILGIAAAAIFFMVGPGMAMVSGQLTSTPKVDAFAHEPNLYAIFLAAMVPFAAERFRVAPTLRSATALALILAAIGVGVTRSAYLGLLVGVPAYALLVHWRHGSRQLVLRATAICVAAAVVGMLVAPVLLDTARRDANLVAPGEPPVNPPGLPSANPPGLPSANPPGLPSANPPFLPPANPPFLPPANLGTLEFRLERIGPALAEFGGSPLIGLGAYSFGQRHLLPDGSPDHIAILAVAVPYEAGVLGAIVLGAFFVLLLLRLWRATKDPPRAGLAAAYIGSVLILLVAYQATNALHFGFTWLIIGAGVGLTLAEGAPDSER